ncbi:uncharacterized protein BROUX77_004224 [Berkeleyomyces rouxiae]|uniref:uncharacterized protein n=1 Tax=Berkeleyomyces rouxiae TaxID=2035830 RepID=UPI003B7BC03D
MRFSLAAIIAASAALAAPSGSHDTKSSLDARAKTTYVVFIKDSEIVPKFINNVDIGDDIRFEFGTGFQSVVEADYDLPCYLKQGGFASGTFITPPKEEKNSFGFTITIANTEPIWFYNGMHGNCHKNKAVGAINPAKASGGKSYSDFVGKSTKARETKNAPSNGGTKAPL